MTRKLCSYLPVTLIATSVKWSNKWNTKNTATNVVTEQEKDDNTHLSLVIILARLLKFVHTVWSVKGSIQVNPISISFIQLTLDNFSRVSKYLWVLH